MFDKTISNVEEVLARGGKVVLLTDSAGAAGAPAVWKLVEMPAVPAVLAAIVYCRARAIVGVSYRRCQRHGRGSAEEFGEICDCGIGLDRI